MPTGMRPADAAPFALRRGGDELLDAARALEGELDRVTVAEVLEKANRVAGRKRPTPAWGDMRRPPLDWYTFDAADNATRQWYPQGVTCASAAGERTPALLVSWYWKPEPQENERGARVTFLDPDTAAYRHALLVAPRADGSFGAVDIHAGGIAWYGDHLYVADTVRGLRVFAMDRVLDMRTGRDGVGDRTRLGRSDGELHAYGYRYVIPQVGHWRVTTPGARFSFVAVDRSGERDLLISGEYVDAPGGTGRVARWALGPDGSPETSGDGTAVPVDAFRLPGRKIQGALSHDGHWYFSQSAGASGNGTLIVVDPDGGRHRRAYPVGPEDLTCWRERKELWSVTEFAGRRALFGVSL